MSDLSVLFLAPKIAPVQLDAHMAPSSWVTGPGFDHYVLNRLVAA